MTKSNEADGKAVDESKQEVREIDVLKQQIGSEPLMAPCEHLVPIGDGGYGFCPVHERHVSTPAYEAATPVPRCRCLCDYCKPGPDGKPRIDEDVFFYRNDLIGLKSVERELFEKMLEAAEGMKCAVPAPGPKPVAAPKPVAPVFRKPQKPQPKLF